MDRWAEVGNNSFGEQTRRVETLSGYCQALPSSIEQYELGNTIAMEHNVIPNTTECCETKLTQFSMDQT